MKHLLLALLLSSCSALMDRKPLFVPYANRLDQCIQTYLQLDIKPEQAVAICEAIHGKRQ